MIECYHEALKMVIDVENVNEVIDIRPTIN